MVSRVFDSAEDTSVKVFENLTMHLVSMVLNVSLPDGWSTGQFRSAPLNPEGSGLPQIEGTSAEHRQ